MSEEELFEFRQCLVCSKEFMVVIWNPNQKYCSKRCSNNAREKLKKIEIKEQLQGIDDQIKDFDRRKRQDNGF